MTRVLTVHPEQPEADAVLEAANAIRAGGLVAFPTETVYGLGADGLDADAVRRIFAAKERPSSDPLILHLADASWLARVALLPAALEAHALRLAERFWPGPLTLVLPKLERVPPEVTAGGPSVAVRVPAHGVALALIRAADTPIAAPSANLFGRPSPTVASDVLEDLRGRVDIVLDGGPTSIGVESTVLDVRPLERGGPPVLLRPGGVTLEALTAALGEVALPGEMLQPDEAAPAPGMMLRHYSPRARLLVVAGATGPNLERALRTVAQSALDRGERLGLLLPEASLEGLSDLDAVRYPLGADLNGVASSLFRGMRALDRLGVDAILTHGFDDTGLGRALNDRLFRAAEGRLIRADV